MRKRGKVRKRNTPLNTTPWKKKRIRVETEGELGAAELHGVKIHKGRKEGGQSRLEGHLI